MPIEENTHCVRAFHLTAQQIPKRVFIVHRTIAQVRKRHGTMKEADVWAPGEFAEEL